MEYDAILNMKSRSVHDNRTIPASDRSGHFVFTNYYNVYENGMERCVYYCEQGVVY